MDTDCKYWRLNQRNGQNEHNNCGDREQGITSMHHKKFESERREKEKADIEFLPEHWLDNRDLTPRERGWGWGADREYIVDHTCEPLMGEPGREFQKEI